MSFLSFPFFVLLTITGIIYYRMRPQWKGAFLLTISYGFYALGDPSYFVLLIGVSAITYRLGLGLATVDSEKIRGLLLAAGVVGIGGLLIYFKAAGALTGLVLPLGISYYSFKIIAYLVEVYWDPDQCEHDFLIFLLYPAFFPQIVSGPIQRPAAFFAQIRDSVSNKIDTGKIEEGFRLIIGGLLLKLIIGDRLAVFIGIVNKSPGDYNHEVLAVTALCYTLQLYADFAGYSNIAIGLGKIFGIDAPPNFNAPFAAPNISDMWRRWHMSLTTWLNDYVFTTLRMLLRNWGTAGLIFSIAINMISVGVWHGFTLNYLIFGVIHSIFLIVTVQTKKIRDAIFGKSLTATRFRIVTGCILTFLMMTFSQIFFHSASFPAAWSELQRLVGALPAGRLGWNDIRTDAVDPIFLCMGIAYFVGVGAPGMHTIRGFVARWIPNWVELGLYLLILSSLSIEAGTSFVYGQF